MTARIELYRERVSDIGEPTRPGKWRWRYVSNGRVMADGGQGYSRRIDCLNGCAAVLGAEFVPHGFARGFTDGVGYADLIPVRDLTKAVAS